MRCETHPEFDVITGECPGCVADDPSAEAAAARLTEFAASLGRVSILRDIATVRNAGVEGPPVSHLLTELQGRLITILDAREDKR